MDADESTQGVRLLRTRALEGAANISARTHARHRAFEPHLEGRAQLIEGQHCHTHEDRFKFRERREHVSRRHVSDVSLGAHVKPVHRTPERSTDEMEYVDE